MKNTERVLIIAKALDYKVKRDGYGVEVYCKTVANSTHLHALLYDASGGEWVSWHGDRIKVYDNGK